MPEILEVLFGSKSRSRVMRFFVLNPERQFDFAEVREHTQMKAVDVRRDIASFVKIGLIKARKRKGKRTHILNETFPYYAELRDLFVKSNVYPQCTEVKNLTKIGRVKLVMISGVFLNYNKASIDLLIVGDDISRVSLKAMIKRIEAEIGHEVRYMALSMEDFDYRLEMMDRFVIEFLTGPQDMIYNRIPRLGRFIAEYKN